MHQAVQLFIGSSPGELVVDPVNDLRRNSVELVRKQRRDDGELGARFRGEQIDHRLIDVGQRLTRTISYLRIVSRELPATLLTQRNDAIDDAV